MFDVDSWYLNRLGHNRYAGIEKLARRKRITVQYGKLPGQIRNLTDLVVVIPQKCPHQTFAFFVKLQSGHRAILRQKLIGRQKLARGRGSEFEPLGWIEFLELCEDLVIE